VRAQCRIVVGNQGATGERARSWTTDDLAWFPYLGRRRHREEAEPETRLVETTDGQYLLLLPWFLAIVDLPEATCGHASPADAELCVVADELRSALPTLQRE